MRLKKVVLVLAILLIPGLALSDTLKDEAAAKRFTDSVMEKVSRSDLDGAFKAMKPYMALSSTEVDAVANQAKAQRELYGKRYGDPIAFEHVSKKKVGRSLLRLQYIEKTVKHALPWTFYFYKTEKGWTLNELIWNDQFHGLFLTN